MQWAEAIKEFTSDLKPVKASIPLLQRILGLVDLTSLNENDSEQGIASFCQKAQLPLGHVAAVCVYRPFVRLVAAQFAGTPIKTATVVNFPEGNSSLQEVLLEIGQALQAGAQEIDLVFPYERYLAGEQQYARTFISECKAACAEATLKVILETGALIDPAIIADAAFDALNAGADFIKTSTGKIAQGATLEAAATMLLVIRHVMPQLKRNVGIKISGGIKNVEQAAMYMQLAEKIMGREWSNPENFRIGASKLVDEIAKELELG